MNQTTDPIAHALGIVNSNGQVVGQSLNQQDPLGWAMNGTGQTAQSTPAKKRPGRPRSKNDHFAEVITQSAANSFEWAVSPKPAKDWIHYYEDGIWEPFATKAAFEEDLRLWYEGSANKIAGVVWNDQVRSRSWRYMVGKLDNIGMVIGEANKNAMAFSNTVVDWTSSSGYQPRSAAKNDFFKAKTDYPFATGKWIDQHAVDMFERGEFPPDDWTEWNDNPELIATPVTDKFLLDCADSEGYYAHWIKRLLAEIMFNQNKSRKIVFLVGRSGAGKSVLTQYIRSLLGDSKQGYSIGINQEDLTSTFGMSDLAREPKVITIDEVRQRGFPVFPLKKLTGAGDIRIEEKYKKSYEVYWRGHVVLNGNEMPNIDDVGLRNRAVVLPFSYVPDNPDPDLLDKLKAERPLFARKLAELFQTDKSNLFQNLPNRVKDETMDAAYGDDHFARWFDECVEKDNDCSGEAYKDVYNHYFQWYQQNVDLTGDGIVKMGMFRRKMTGEKPKTVKRGRTMYLRVRLN